MNHNVTDLNAVKAEKELAEYYAELDAYGDEELFICEVVEVFEKKQRELGLSQLAGNIAGKAWYIGYGIGDEPCAVGGRKPLTREPLTEAETIDDLTAVRTAAKAAAINTAIAEAKQAGLWPWDDNGQFRETLVPFSQPDFVFDLVN